MESYPLEDEYQELYKRAVRGEISRKDVAKVIAQLEKPQPEADPYTLLSTLCYCYTEAKQYLHLVEHYLDGPDDLAASKALWVLCSCWDRSAQYADKMLEFMKGVPWDVHGDCQSMAVACAGTHLRLYTSPEMLRKVIELLEEEVENDRWIRSTAYRTLVEITGGDWRNLPFDFDPKTSIDPAVVKKAKERLAREESLMG